MIQKILSCGREGAESAARDAAIKLDIAYRVCTGRTASMADAPDRADSDHLELHVVGSEGSLILNHGKLRGEWKEVQRLAEKHARPLLHIDLNRVPAFKASAMLAEWLLEHHISILHVTGAEPNAAPDIYEKTLHILTSAFWLSIEKSVNPNPPRPEADNDRSPPRNVKEAVERLTMRMPLKDRITIANMTEDELYTLNFTIGSYIRNRFGIWTGNEALLQSCRAISGDGSLHPKDASSVIIRSLWKELRKTHKLRVVK